MDKLVSEKKPSRRMCRRCNSDNTKFCYFVNSSQPLYTCRYCRRSWIYRWALRNIPMGGERGRKTKRQKIDQPSVSQVNSAENHFGSFSVVLALPAQNAPPKDRMEVSDGSFYQGYHDVGSNGANQEDPNKNLNASTDHMIKNNNNNNV
ncbi:dof zinc finger protein DOF4.4-like [Brassica napus]|uniref:dof zinc finger protein DOF4.4-like n=1 Tax=Brassica napus TaxID=3708 RepID=UPI0006AAB9CC|nr:dof zinc finger protein DOF4.4-like [Brassica napus]